MEESNGKTLLVLGGSGLVGMEVLRQALVNPAISRVVAPSRSPLPMAVRHYSHLDNPQVDFAAKSTPCGRYDDESFDNGQIADVQ